MRVAGAGDAGAALWRRTWLYARAGAGRSGQGADRTAAVTNLYLHIGQSKTGSSYIQSCLARSATALAKAGIDYYRGDEGEARNWRISSGNGRFLVNDPVESLTFSQDSVLFSAEQLTTLLGRDREFADKLGRFCAYHGVRSVRMLLFIRDPIPHAESTYQQQLKRGGETGGPEALFDRYRMPVLIRTILQQRTDFPGLRVEVFNYDRHRDGLIPIVARWLGLPGGVIAEQDARPVNRSLSLPEQALQRAVNARLGAGGSFLSDALCNALPDIAAGRAYPPLEVQQRMLDRLRPAIEAVNAIVPQAERYRCDLQPPAAQQDALAFTPAQIDTIGEAFGARIAGLERELLLERIRRQILLAESLPETEVDRRAALLQRCAGQLEQLDRSGADREPLHQLRQRLDALRVPPAQG